MNLTAFVNAQGEAIYYKNLIESDLDSFLALWEDKRFKRRVLGPSHPKAGAPRQDQRMRARIAAIKRRMDLFFRPESCQNPWPADSSKVMESWFSVLDYHPCAVADNLIQGIEIWLHNYGCQDAIFVNVEIMFDTSKMKPSRIERLVARRRKTILKKNSKIAKTPCKDKFYDPETTTNIATTWSTVTTPSDTTTSTGPQTSTTTTAWESTTSTTPWASTPWTDNNFFGF
ncbi:unnamed protein product [Oikopleura dioica]|uniref:Uncharacterized protein n=1 Tax=Oikopleura dioica TaxID=34765 RepID=E4YRR7_OIKDI|nr:unnamed protein product [Oikopleura dioica]